MLIIELLPHSVSHPLTHSNAPIHNGYNTISLINMRLECVVADAFRLLSKTGGSNDIEPTITTSRIIQANIVIQKYALRIYMIHSNISTLAKYPSVGRVSAMVLRCHWYLNTVVVFDYIRVCITVSHPSLPASLPTYLPPSPSLPPSLPPPPSLPSLLPPSIPPPTQAHLERLLAYR